MEDWSSLAESWHSFRQKPFPPIVEKLAAQWTPGKLLDIGCGNCRNIIPFAKKGFNCTGIDFSEEMVEFARVLLQKNQAKAKLLVANAEKLPFKDKTYNYVLNIAVIHTLKNRNSAIRETYRVLRNEGIALITVWNKWQKRFIFGSKEQIIPWKTKNKTINRYYYFYNYFELRRELINAGFKIVYGKGIFGKNIVFVVTK
jgi:ubiquinone/menaquinone biosynthesis C-methylase UbiE